MICFLGSSHAANHLRRAAQKLGFHLTHEPEAAAVVFISEDTPTDAQGNRSLIRIIDMVKHAATSGAQLVLTSQVPPGFTRALRVPNILHQAETLRILDAEERALHPEYIAVGGPYAFHPEYAEYLLTFQCPVLRMTWEEAEFSKIAVNMALAAQVDYTNRLSAAATKIGVKWENVTKALRLDSRIGAKAYLTPGRWQDSNHLLRDAITLVEIECTAKPT
jgi:UDPglucose 6-dehydrogenase